MKLDLHVHSQYSHDGEAPVRALIDRARKVGLDGIAITDHNSLAGSLAALDLDAADFLVIPGAEYSTNYGHMLAYHIRQGAEDTLRRNGNGRFWLEELSPFVHEQGGQLFWAHPFDGRSLLSPVALGLVDGLEVTNARADARAPWRRHLAGEAAARHHLLMSAGTDAHVLRELGSTWIEGNTIVSKDLPLRCLRECMRRVKRRLS